MGGVRPNRKVTEYFRRAYLCVSAICALSPAGPLAAFSRTAKWAPRYRYPYRRQRFINAHHEAIS